MMAVRMGAPHLHLFLLFLFLASAATASTQSQPKVRPGPSVVNLNDKQALYNASRELTAAIPINSSSFSLSDILFITDKELLASPTFTRDIPLLADPLKIVANINTLAHNLWGPNGENLVAFLLAHPHVIIVGGAVMHAASTHPTRGKDASDIDIFVLAEEEEVLYETLRAFVASFTLLEGKKRQIVIDRLYVVLTFTVEGCGKMMIQMVKKDPPTIGKGAQDNERRKDVSVYARKGLEPFLTSALLTVDAPLIMFGIGACTRGGRYEDEEQPAGGRELTFQASVETLYGIETGLVRYWQITKQREVSIHTHARTRKRTCTAQMNIVLSFLPITLLPFYMNIN
jgi:hypothetical protein